MLKCHLCITAPNPSSWNRWAEKLPNVVYSLNEQSRRDGHSPLDRLLVPGQVHLKGVWKDASLLALQEDQGSLMLLDPTIISKGQEWSWPWVIYIYGPSSSWMVMVCPSALDRRIN
jgi:hypothetical protein